MTSILQNLAGLENQSISLSQLTEKWVMLMALVKAQRVSTLRALSFQNMYHKPNGVRFAHPTKTQRVGSAPKEFFLPSFARNQSLCPVLCLDEYLSRTATLRSGAGSGLFVSTRPPHQDASSSTLARWLKKTLKTSGVASSFTAHSTR